MELKKRNLLFSLTQILLYQLLTISLFLSFIIAEILYYEEDSVELISLFRLREPTQKPKSHFDFVSNYLVGVYCEGETDVTFIGEILNQPQFVDASYIRQVNSGGTSKSAYHKLISHLKEKITFISNY